MCAPRRALEALRGAEGDDGATGQSGKHRWGGRVNFMDRSLMKVSMASRTSKSFCLVSIPIQRCPKRQVSWMHGTGAGGT
jgi:hypothetical protein